jgi:CheY-like chemotaxis protein
VIARLLVVDDEPSVRSFAERVLSDAGYGVTLAADGLAALAVLEHEAPFRPAAHGPGDAEHERRRARAARGSPRPT